MMDVKDSYRAALVLGIGLLVMIQGYIGMVYHSGIAPIPFYVGISLTIIGITLSFFDSLNTNREIENYLMTPGTIYFAINTINQACLEKKIMPAISEESDQLLFEKEKFAVFVFEGEYKEEIPNRLTDEGWNVISFDSTEVTDGIKEAEVILDYLNEIQFSGNIASV